MAAPSFDYRPRRPEQDVLYGILRDHFAVLVPRPRINLLLYQGVLGARSAWRAEAVRLAGAPAAEDVGPAAAQSEPGAPRFSPARGLQWPS